jgi:hypothetical protein
MPRDPLGDRPRLVLVEGITITSPEDRYLSLRALATYSGLSVRKLRDYFNDPARPLPCYRVGGKLLVRRSEFDTWIAAYRHAGRADVDQIVSDVLRSLQSS